MNNQQVAIQLTNVSKKYEIHHEKPTLVEKFMKGHPPGGGETFWALKDINLTICKGEKVGFIGPNGSGKTTLLKSIAGITTPTYGAVATRGRVVSLIDLGAGFHPDLTGYQNIYLNAMLLGMTKSEVEKNLSSIIAFADIKQFIDAPLYTYSSGMALRLGFAIAIHAAPDILLVDEGLAVGDKEFQKKSATALRHLMKRHIAILMVSHTIALIKKICSRIVILNHGMIVADGTLALLKKYGYEV